MKMFVSLLSVWFVQYLQAIDLCFRLFTVKFVMEFRPRRTFILNEQWHKFMFVKHLYMYIHYSYKLHNSSLGLSWKLNYIHKKNFSPVSLESKSAVLPFYRPVCGHVVLIYPRNVINIDLHSQCNCCLFDTHLSTIFSSPLHHTYWTADSVPSLLLVFTLIVLQQFMYEVCCYASHY